MDNGPSSAALPLDEYSRYGRQMILSGFGLPAQLRLRQSSVVIVGAGGLGCPALQYLAAAGVGNIAIVDHDTVEMSNLHRQVLHTEARAGTPKALSAADAIKQINSHINAVPIVEALAPTNASKLLAPYDLILDCTDNMPTRYLLSDTAVRLGKPLISGAAQQLDGQLCVYNLPLSDASQSRGPCFRCLFPKPPAPENVGSCEALGVLGPVTGVIGVLQAMEAIKIITGLHDRKPTMLMYSAFATPPFRSIKLRTRQPTCTACGTLHESEWAGKIDETDYVAFCGGPRPDWLARGVEGADDREKRISAKELHDALSTAGRRVRIIDVRPPTEFGICYLPGSTNIPLNQLVADPSSKDRSILSGGSDVHLVSHEDERPEETYVVCRLGNDSQIAADALRAASVGGVVKDLVGGLRAWATEVDPNFPVY
ncbi:uncharacterized protein C8Q71DRAFT_752867 [Rhodofomes roseus]|uniref:Rhodanese domain-containing protein n=1 Tax=Rhodofomes roseus TaxID=34475 RepID=A0ABQ8KLM4_9APHY|nr:uncharacterized protein C8Q71DRAFT_752867 [Rhodofomes roseus]KAH9838788.1 hypothetical protein C8Q71DRAFT_752867 [Rhodofomes roseus]